MNVTSGRAWLFRLLGIASGALLMVPHLASRLAPLQLVALLPILYVLASSEASLRIALTAGVYLALAYTLPQVMALRMPLAVALILLLDMVAVSAVFAGVGWKLLRQRSVGGAFAVGALLAVLDWANFTAVPIWGTAQSLVRPWSQYPHVIQFVSITGITGIAFALTSVQALAVSAAVRRKGQWRPLSALAVVAAAFSAANVFAGPGEPAGRLKVATVGWTVADFDTHGDPDTAKGFDALYAGPLAKAARRGARLVVSPEVGFVFAAPERAGRLERFGALARQHGVFLAVGYADYTREENRMLFIGPDGDLLGEYTKTHLVAFERFHAGSGGLTIVQVEGTAVGGMICQDDNFTDLSRAYGRRGVAVMAVPTNDWLAVKDAHFQGSVHRAIESRYAIVRAASNGISAIIAPTGEVLARRDHYEAGPGVTVAEVPLYAERTSFSRFGHWPVAPGAAFVVGWLGWLFVRGRRRPEPADAAAE